MYFFNKIFFISLLLTLIGGCAAMLVPETNDPAQKLRDAYMLFDKQKRPLPAERLIRESIDIYKKSNDELGLAEAYKAYGYFFRSGAVEKYHKHYNAKGFIETSASYNTRHDKSIEYFDKAKEIYLKNSKYGDVTNIYLNMGFTYEFANNNEKACESYKKSLNSNIKHLEMIPEAPIVLPSGFKSYEEYINGFNKRLGCW